MTAALAQTCNQLASWHSRNAEHAATDDGSRTVGHGMAEVAAMHLTRTAGLLTRATDALDEAHNANSRLAWPPPQDESLNLGPGLSRGVSPGRPQGASAESRLGEPSPLRIVSLDDEPGRGLS